MDPGRPVVVVGGGVAGLSAAWFLRQQLPEQPVVLLEAEAHTGGKVRSLHEGGRILDLGPNGWLSGEPAMTELIVGLGLEGERVRPAAEARERWIFARGRLHPVPLSPGALWRSRLLSLRAKARLFADLLLPRGPEEASVGQFFARRFGPEVRDLLAAPMVAGIHAADPDELDLHAAFPRLWELERSHRSLILGMLSRRGLRPQLETLRGGAGTLTRALAEALAADPLTELRTACPGRALEQRGTSWRVHTDDARLDASAVIVACPAPAAATLVRGLDGELANPLDAIPYAPVAVVVGRAEPDTWPTPPRGFGALAARGAELGGVLGVLFTSRVFPEQAREGEHLFRVFLGGALHADVPGLDDQALVGRAWEALELMLGPAREPPECLHIARWARGIPQYTPGHLGRLRDIHRGEARHGGLFFTGNHLEGVAVKDTVRLSRGVAERAARCIAERSLDPV